MARRKQSRRIVAGFGALLVALATLGSMALNMPANGASSTAPSSGLLLGAYANAKSGQSTYEAVDQLESMLGRKLAVVNKYHPFTDHSYPFEKWNLEQGRLPMISWRGTDSTPDANRASKISAGLFDTEIRAAADGLKALPGPVLLRFNWEMDQSSGDRQYIGTPAEFIAAWRHIYGVFQSRGATNVEFVWAPRAASFKKNVGQQFYPGDAYVDWIGGSAVPIDNYASFTELYGGLYDWASTKDKPILIWAGIQEKDGDAAWKANWFKGAQAALKTMPKVKAFVYYHALAPKGGHYWIDTSAASLSAFKQLSADSYFTKMPVFGGGGGGGGDDGGGDGTGSAVFSDGFESGNLSNWQTKAGGISAQVGLSHGGNTAARAVSGSNGLAYTQTSIPGGARYEFTYDLWFNVQSASTNATLAKLLIGPNGQPFSLSVRRDGTLVTWNNVTTRGDASNIVASPGAWHHLTIAVKINGVNGSLQVSLDGSVLDGISGEKNLGTQPISGIQLGNSTTGRDFDIAFDDVTVSVP